MGYGFRVYCGTCGFENNVYDDYGGIYDYYTYECFDCRDYFIIKTVHEDMKTPSVEDKPEGMPLFEYLLEFGLKGLHINPTCEVRCEKCNGKRVERISYFPGGEWKPKNLKRRCPKCKKRLNFDEGFWFDD